MIVILMGAPGAGKGTQADYLREDKGFIKISTGDLLRREVSSHSELGRKVRDIMDSGGLVSDSILLQIVKNALELYKDRNLVLDGFPRTVVQAQWLEENAAVSGVIHIDVDQEELIERLSGRLVCGTCESVYHSIRKPPMREGVCDKCGGTLNVRQDDRRDRVLHRLKVYLEQTAPVVDFYKRNSRYFRVDGNAGELAVSGEIDKLLSKLEG